MERTPARGPASSKATAGLAASAAAQAAKVRCVGLVAPSGFLPDPGVADRAASFFTARGWRVCAGETVFAREMRFAGSDELRASELQRFATDRALDLVVAARGGYGVSRLLDRLDFRAIGEARRILVGYSDFTAFGLALLARAGAVSFQGPSAADFGSRGDSEFTMHSFFEAIEQPEVSIEFAADGPDLEVQGRLWGGNLSMLCALVGTPYLPRVRGGILFLEDVNEPAYRIERMLLHLLQAGILQRQRAILLGDFAPMPTLPTDNGFDLSAAVRYVRSVLPTPVVSGLPFGHGVRRLTLPIGASGRLQVRADRARLKYRGHPVLG
jgi:muramoyltetrapeptide carboxypeptidase